MSIERTQNDTDSDLVDRLVDGDNDAVDISGYNHVEIHIRKPGGGVITDDTSGNVFVTNEDNARVRYVFSDTDLDEIGTYYYEWEVEHEDTGVETWPSDSKGIVISVREEIA